MWPQEHRERNSACALPLLSFLLIQCGSFLFRCPLLFPPRHLCCSMQAPQAEDSVGHMSTSVVCEVKSFQEKVCFVAWGSGGVWTSAVTTLPAWATVLESSGHFSLCGFCFSVRLLPLELLSMIHP